MRRICLLAVCTCAPSNPSPTRHVVVRRDSTRLRHVFEYEAQVLLGGYSPEVVDSMSVLADAPESESLDWLPRLAGTRATFRAITPLAGSPELLLEYISDANIDSAAWTICNVCLSLWSGRDQALSTKMLLCAISQRLGGAPMLRDDPSKHVDRLALVETRAGFMLGRCFSEQGAALDEASLAWKKRPYSFSAALSLELADAVVNTLVARFARTPRYAGSEDLVFYDACCGSGTSLFAASRAGFATVVGTDINPEAASGAMQNLRHCGINNSSMLSLSVRTLDAASQTAGELKIASVVFANLPWGENKFEYYGTNDKIIARIGQGAAAHTQIAFVTRETIDAATVAQAGLTLVDVIPVDQDSDSSKKRAGKCVIGIYERRPE